MDGSHPDAARPDAARPDAARPDAGAPPDSGSPLGAIGAPCETDAQCSSGMCLDERAWNSTGGACSASCAGGRACPAGSACIENSEICLAACNPSADPSAACERRGTICGIAGMIAVCIPACRERADCAPGEVCDDGAQCRDPLATPRGGCRINQDCGPAEWCRQEHVFGFPGGQCTDIRCDVGEECWGGGLCVMHTAPNGLSRQVCLARCASDGDCRAGYACADTACRPRCESDAHCIDPLTRCDVGSGLCVET